ncbi:hypothetical protein JG687_00013469, partial [Phytophthora cactorum]
REAGPRGICVGGPSAELTSEPRIALSSTFYLYIASEARVVSSFACVALQYTTLSITHRCIVSYLSPRRFD